MKKMFLFLIAISSFLLVNAQTVTVKVKGDRNYQVLIDGQSYAVNRDVSAATGINIPITIQNLSLGQHTLQVIRRNPSNSRTTPGMSASFTLRTGFDMNITVNANGSIQLAEAKTSTSATGTREAMSESDFDILLSNIESQRTQSRRIVAVRNAFNNTAYYFSTAQVYDLISTVTSQAQRLSLAKTAYKTVVDGENYNELNDLFTSQVRRNDLAKYVDTYNTSNPGHIGSVNMAMSAAQFDALYKNVQGQWPSSARMTYLSSNVFGPATNYFTIAQARQMISVMSTEAERLQLAKEAYDNLTSPKLYTQFNDLFTYQTSRNELANYVNNKDLSNPRIPMNATKFNQLYLDVRQQWSYSEKVKMIQDAFLKTDNYFTTTQAKELILMVTNETDRLSLAKSAWDNITDPGNYSQMYDLFSSTASRNDFNAFLNSGAGYSGSVPVVTAMSTESFDALYSRISNQWGLGVKMSSLSDVFENTENHFTVAQAKKLITLVSAEYNRLTLAKSSYDNIVDRENFNQLYDIFDSQASKNELEAYVNSYSYNR